MSSDDWLNVLIANPITCMHTAIQEPPTESERIMPDGFCHSNHQTGRILIDRLCSTAGHYVRQHASYFDPSVKAFTKLKAVISCRIVGPRLLSPNSFHPFKSATDMMQQCYVP
jgi:hypothetical protein